MCIEYIEGREVTVDCFVSPECQLLSFNIRTREKTLGEMAVICRNYTEPRIEPIVRQITTRYRFAGCINMQFMLTDERVVVIDLNTRYPSWGLPLTVESGIKVPELMLCYAKVGHKINPCTRMMARTGWCTAISGNTTRYSHDRPRL